MGHAGSRIRIEDGKIELIFRGVEIDKKVVDFVENRIRAGIGSVNLIEQHDGGQTGLQGLLQHIARLRKRAFAGVNQKEHAVNHAQRAFNLAAEVAVARRIDNIDFRAVVPQRRVFGQNGDAALALEVVRVHHTVDHGLILAENAALAKHGVQQRRLAVVHVSDNRDVADRLRHAFVILLRTPANERGCKRDLAAPLQKS